MIKEKLQQLGLNTSEIVVYLDLLENGLSSPPLISRRTNITRTNCYNVLGELVNRDLIVEQVVEGRKAYLPRDPEALLLGLERKKEIVTDLLPQLRGLYTTHKNKPKIKFYDGLGQMEQIFLASLNAKTIYGFVSMGKLFHVKQFGPSYMTALRDLKIEFLNLAPLPTEGTPDKRPEYGLDDNYKERYLPNGFTPFPTETLIWGDNIAMLNMEDPAFGTVITNKAITDTFRSMHAAMWKQAEIVSRETI